MVGDRRPVWVNPERRFNHPSTAIHRRHRIRHSRQKQFALRSCSDWLEAGPPFCGASLQNAKLLRVSSRAGRKLTGKMVPGQGAATKRVFAVQHGAQALVQKVIKINIVTNNKRFYLGHPLAPKVMRFEATMGQCCGAVEAPRSPPPVCSDRHNWLESAARAACCGTVCGSLKPCCKPCRLQW